MRSWSTYHKPIRVQDSSYFSLEFFRCFQSYLSCKFQLLLLRMNLDSFRRVWEQLDLFWWRFSIGDPSLRRSIVRFQPIERRIENRIAKSTSRDAADRSRHSSRTIGSSDAQPTEHLPVDRARLPSDRDIRRSIAHYCRSIATSAGRSPIPSRSIAPQSSFSSELI